MADSRPTLIKSVSRAMRLLEAVASSTNPPNAAQLSSTTGLARSTTYHLLRTLVEEGYISVTPDHTYAPTERMENLGRMGREGLRHARALEVMWALRDSLKRPVYLSFVRDGRLEIDIVVDNHRVRALTQYVPFSDVPYATALGKAAIGAMDSRVRLEFLRAQSFIKLTPKTITSPTTVLKHCELLRNGIAIDDGEYQSGVACLAMPVFGQATVGAVGIDIAPGSIGRYCQRADQLRRTAEQLTRIHTLQ